MCACYNIVGAPDGGFDLRNYDVKHIDSSYNHSLEEVCSVSEFAERCEKLLGQSDEAFELEFANDKRWGENYPGGCVPDGIVSSNTVEY
jgi:hypothetical protein